MLVIGLDQWVDSVSERRRGWSIAALLDVDVINSLTCHRVEWYWMGLVVSPQAS